MHKYRCITCILAVVKLYEKVLLKIWTNSDR